MNKEERVVVCYVTRADVAHMVRKKYGGRKAGGCYNLSDRNLNQIAMKMNDAICDGAGYWSACLAAYEYVMKRD